MSKHTPGPWTVWNGHSDVYAGPISSNTPGGIIGKPHQRLVCVAICDEDEEITDREQRANARLIAAAPLLLEACKATVAADEASIKEIQKEFPDYEPSPPNRAITDLLRTAIATAEGETPDGTTIPDYEDEDDGP